MSAPKNIGDDCKWQFMGSECDTNLKCNRDLQICTLENGRLDIQDIERQIVKKNKVAVEKLLIMNPKLANHDNRFASSLYHMQPIDIAVERPDNQEIIKFTLITHLSADPLYSTQSLDNPPGAVGHFAIFKGSP